MKGFDDVGRVPSGEMDKKSQWTMGRDENRLPPSQEDWSHLDNQTDDEYYRTLCKARYMPKEQTDLEAWAKVIEIQGEDWKWAYSFVKRGMFKPHRWMYEAPKYRKLEPVGA